MLLGVMGKKREEGERATKGRSEKEEGEKEWGVARGTRNEGWRGR